MAPRFLKIETTLDGEKTPDQKLWTVAQDWKKTVPDEPSDQWYK